MCIRDSHTQMIGKWHLGHLPRYLPTNNGFDSYYGIPYSNDMDARRGFPNYRQTARKDPNYVAPIKQYHVPVIEGTKVVERPANQHTITGRYTDKGVEFIRANKDKPFFVYLPHSMPHIPLYVPDEVRDPNPKNAYINTIEHIDSEVGRLLKVLDDLKLVDNTYVIYTTDNGPWLQFRHHGGSAGPLREGKGTTFEGGQRVPCVMRGPGIPVGTVCDELTGTIDVLPTIAALTGKPLPSGRKIDGMDASGLWQGTAKTSPRKEFLHYTSRGDIEGLRSGNLKLLVTKPRASRRPNAKQPNNRPTQIFLFDLSKDLGEQNNLAEAKSDVVKELRARMEALDAEITKNARQPWFCLLYTSDGCRRRLRCRSRWSPYH